MCITIDVEKETKHTIITIAAAAVIIVVIFTGISVASGSGMPQTTVVESQSMQHGTGSQIGIIDTADMIILKDRDKADIHTYVEGYISGYSAFGNYGDVVVYSRGEGFNPVIHRVILWLDYNGDGTWSAPSLKDYPEELWTSASGDDYTKLSGKFTMHHMKYDGSAEPYIELDRLAELYPFSGYLTMGDNNTVFDQPNNVMGVNGLVPEENIKSVAWIEVPWVGVFRMMMIDKMYVVNEQVPNTVPSLIATILLVIFLLVGIGFVFDQRYYRKYRKELSEEMNAPTPLLPVESKNK